MRRPSLSSLSSLLPLLLVAGLLSACLDSTAPTKNLGSNPAEEVFAPTLQINLAEFTKIEVPDFQRAVWYKDLVTSDTGHTVAQGDSLRVRYSLWLRTGELIQAGGPVEFRIRADRVILGWVIGLPGMKTGGKRRLVIPSALAYGEAGVSGIPPNSTLIFDVEALRIAAPAAATGAAMVPPATP